jgi:hypothetical protein
MTEKRRDEELRDLLHEGAAALREMRKRLENARADLQGFYWNMLTRNPEKPWIETGTYFQRAQNTKGSHPEN